ncbi:MAG: hypothetical protein WC849_02600 [Candidatus Paceibacterota bacterium]
MQNKIKKFFVPITIIGLLVVFGFFYTGIENNSNEANAASESFNLAGWAWSDNIGWISFSCLNTNTCNTSNYRVSVGGNGDLSGYAWSDNIGWISFNQGDSGSCPIATCKAKLSGNEVMGWAKALSADYFGWDGWINLRRGSGPAFGVSFNSGTKKFGGYAWGSDVVGWINFNGVVVDDGSLLGGSGMKVALDAFPTAVNVGEKVKLFWENENVITCNTSSGPWSGTWSDAEALLGSKENVGPINTNTEFKLKCLNILGQEKEDNVLVTIVPADFSLQKSGNIEIVGVRGTSTPATITILPQNNFSLPISLSVSYLPPQLSGANIVLSKGLLSGSHYNSGSEFKIVANNPIATGSYLITLQGESGGLLRTVNVILNVDNKNIKIEEF